MKWSPKKQAIFEIAKEQINQCQIEHTTYNSQFLSSSILCAILAAAAGVICTTSETNIVWNLFYILPTIYLFALYNLIKYTTKQIYLETYQWTLENRINCLLHEEVLMWAQKIPHGFAYCFFGAAVQIVFYIPIAVFMFWGFARLTHDTIWWLLLFGLILQSLIVLIMAFRLCNASKQGLSKFGYDISASGKIYPKLLQKRKNKYQKY